MQVSHKQPKLLSDAHRILPKVQQLLKKPVTSKAEFSRALCSVLKIKIPDREGSPEFVPDIVKQFMVILTAYGQVSDYDRYCTLLHGCLLFQSTNAYRHSIINLLVIFSKQVLH